VVGEDRKNQQDGGDGAVEKSEKAKTKALSVAVSSAILLAFLIVGGAIQLVFYFPFLLDQY